MSCWCEGLGCGLGASGSNGLSKTYHVQPWTSNGATAARRGSKQWITRLPSKTQPQGGLGTYGPLGQLLTTPSSVIRNCNENAAVAAKSNAQSCSRNSHWASIVCQARALAKSLSRSATLALQKPLPLDDAAVIRVRRRLWTLFVGAATAMVMCAGACAVLPTPIGEPFEN